MWLGRIPYADVPTYLRGALAALCLIENPGGRSTTGVAPVKLFEAMACGVPVLVSDLPFQSDLVRSASAGWVIPTASSASLAQAVRDVGSDAGERRSRGANGSRYVEANATWHVRGQQIARVLENVCRRSSATPSNVA